MATANCSSMLGSSDVSPPIWTPFTGHNMAPWVKVWFMGGGFEVSVGNESCPASGSRGSCGGQVIEEYAKNHAVIQSFTYGCSGGRTNGSDGIKVEIIDEQGSEFCNFMINIFPKNRDKERPAQDCKMAFQFGWITTTCDDETCVMLSRKRMCTPLQVDVSFIGGMVKFSVSAANPAEILVEGVSSTKTAYPKELKLKEAIIEMFKDYGITPLFLSAVSSGCGGGSCGGFLAEPCFSKEYGSKTASYGGWSFFNSEGCMGKPAGAEGWKTNNKDPIHAAMCWLQEKATNNDPPRGFVVGTCNIGDPTIIFWESPLPDCSGGSHVQNIGTYIVNGGECSSVLSFNPQINWQVANVNQGGNSSETNARSVLSKIDCNISGEGTGDKPPNLTFTSDQYGLNAAEVTAVAHAANARALPPAAAVEAELLIQGNPYLDDPMMLSAGVECSIVVINPFMLRPYQASDPNSCSMDWLADPPTNRFLSNKHWLIQGVSHEIKEGSFTTTLKVWLAAPGVDLDRGAPLGGPGGPTLAKT